MDLRPSRVVWTPTLGAGINMAAEETATTRASPCSRPVFAIRSSKSLYMAKCATWFTAKFSSMPSSLSTVSSWVNAELMPALKTVMSRRSFDLRKALVKARTLLRLAWSTTIGAHDPLDLVSLMDLVTLVHASLIAASRRPASTVLQPLIASCSAVTKPIPALPPVTRHVFPSKDAWGISLKGAALSSSSVMKMGVMPVKNS
mmetsp:Transcript_13545/g.24117  ORF Transcript_13545/g.24117 Transcript_13545/m.24117 type:complete len:202 (-) Transcript_13545:198-803(-)